MCTQEALVRGHRRIGFPLSNKVSLKVFRSEGLSTTISHSTNLDLPGSVVDLHRSWYDLPFSSSSSFQSVVLFISPHGQVWLHIRETRGHNHRYTEVSRQRIYIETTLNSGRVSQRVNRTPTYPFLLYYCA